MNSTFEIEEVSSDFFSALEDAELCHGVKRNLALEISREAGVHVSAVSPPFMPKVRRDVPPDDAKIGDPGGGKENVCVSQEGKTTARKRRLPASLSRAVAVPLPGGATNRRSPPRSSLPRSVVLCETPLEVDSAVARIRRLTAIPSAPRTFGWDIEWLVSFKAGTEPRLTSLMQSLLQTPTTGEGRVFSVETLPHGSDGVSEGAAGGSNDCESWSERTRGRSQDKEGL